MINFIRRIPTAPSLALPLVLALAACGGGGGGDVATSDAPTPVAATGLKLSGTAAVGAPMANAAITVACASGTATATADANGLYSATISNGSLPCVITATSSDGLTELHSVAAGTGSADTTANVTPLSELLVAQMSGGDPKTFVANFTSSTTIAPADVATAQTALMQTLTSAGIDTSAVGDIVGGTITAGSGTGYDGVLDKLKATIDSAGTTLAELTVAVSTSSVGSDTSKSIVGAALAPAATDCPGLKSGTLRVLDFGSIESSLVQVDAVAMTVTSAGQTFPLVKNAACDYSVNDGTTTRVLVARSGMAMLLWGSGANGVASVAIPEQKLDVGTLAGTYDRVQYGATFDTEVGDFGTTVFAANGDNGLSVNCPLGYGKCVEDTQSKGTLVANANGGFDYMESGSSQARVYAFRTPSGRNLILAQSPDGTVTALGAQGALTLPEVGRVASFRQFTVNSAGLSTLTEDSNTVTSVDAGTGTVTRQFASDNHFDTLSFDSPFIGTRYRATNGCTSSTGSAFNCNGVVQLPFGGVVLTVSSVPGKHFMTVSVDKP